MDQPKKNTQRIRLKSISKAKRRSPLKHTKRSQLYNILKIMLQKNIRYISIIFTFSILSCGSYLYIKKNPTILKSIQGDFFEDISEPWNFRADDIIVEGRLLTSQSSILETLNINLKTSLLKISLDSLKKNLEKLPWVRAVIVQRRFPNKLYIRLFERRPIGLWQNNNHMYLIDDLGNIFENQASFPHSSLIITTGENAYQHASTLFDALKEYPNINSRVTGAVFISQRRWDIILDHKLRLKLSEYDIKKSLDSFLKLNRHQMLDDKDIIAIDLRFKDRVFFQLSSEAVEKQNKSKKIPNKGLQ